ncbi:hypothetical protein AXG93_3114s1100 [Marchantia polymorpha subsp. ruderalis]|uniref:Uncharacterized protein n=1 Tax=Marchantia polymorpha subsp. ruderalis TaxID=1480154 RepID=A0A176W871_MARPO|nr:hypothetical protein AXG93_3114s1100 [Marchantia polymorpha subsp. ruderalis]
MKPLWNESALEEDLGDHLDGTALMETALLPSASVRGEPEYNVSGRLTKEEWNDINDLLSYRPDEDLSTPSVVRRKLEEVTRRTQEQLHLVLEERRRICFVCVHLDMDASKIPIPTEALKSGGAGTQLLLDLGHFTLETALEQEHDIEMRGLYSRFYISGSDTSAFLV